VIYSNNTCQSNKIIKKKDCGVNLGEKHMELKIVGSLADHDEVHLMKNVTEVFLIEQRIRNLMDSD